MQMGRWEREGETDDDVGVPLFGFGVVVVVYGVEG